MHVLIVDDSRVMRLLIARVVSQLGCTSSEAADGSEALAQLDRGERPDVILSDWNMPVMDGFTLLTSIRRHADHADVPFVMVTSETEMTQLERALASGANDYVMKPFTAAILRDKLTMLGLVGQEAA